jgi:nucleoside 2-deoxyribosyltransferase
MSFDRPRCYIASPLGFTESGRHYYEHVYLPTLATLVEPIDPWSFTSAEEVLEAQATGRETELWMRVGRRNISAIRAADILVANLDGQEVDSGTASEVGYAAALGKRCFGLRSDLRQSGESGVPVNLQVAAFIEESGGVITGSLNELMVALARTQA